MLTIWTITDGKAGDATQCLGVAEALLRLEPGRVEEHTVHPRVPFSWAMPWGPADPRDGAALAGRVPDIAIASGRRAIPSLRALKARSPSVFTVILKDPRTGSGSADFLWVPEHDRLRGPNVMTTLTAPHRLTPEALEAARTAARVPLLAMPAPRVAVLLGGETRGVRFPPADLDALTRGLAKLTAAGASLMVTPSRRTPPRLLRSVRTALAAGRGWIWDGEGPNPYVEMLALAEAIVVTADSTNMVGEAAATGKPVMVFVPTGLQPKIRQFLDGLRRNGAVSNFEGSLETGTPEPLNATPLIAREILARFRAFSGC